MKTLLKNMRYACLVVIMAIGIQDYIRAIASTQDTMLPPLHSIIFNQDLTPQEKIQMMQNALNDTADINAKDENGRTALNFAIFYKANPAVVQFLIKNKADVNEPDRFDQSPLHNAYRNGDMKSVQILIDSQANQDFKNDQNQLPRDLAQFFDDLDIGNSDDNGGNLNVNMPREEDQMPISPNAFDAFDRANTTSDGLDV